MEMSEKAKAARREYMRKYREKNREKLNKQAREWARNNKDKIKEYKNRHFEKMADEMEAADHDKQKA